MPAGLSDERSLLDRWLDYYRATLLIERDLTVSHYEVAGPP